MTDNEREVSILEIKKLINILNTWGNVLVPSIEGRNTTAREKLNYVYNKLIGSGMTYEEIELEISK